MQAVVFHRYGGPEELVLADVADPVATGGEMLIRVRAIGVNPADSKWRSGMFQSIAPVPLPHIGGYDVAGEVVSGGDLPTGTRIAAMVDTFRSGAYAELTVVGPDRVALLPDGMDFPTAAALPTPGLTGAQIIEENLDVTAGQRVLVTGAAGAVGRFAIRAAKAQGAHVVAAVRASARADALAHGADEVIVLDGSDYEGPPFDRIADTVGGELVAPLCRKVAADGRIVTVATNPIPAEGVSVEIIFVSVHPDAARLARVVDWAASGVIPVPIAARLPLAQAAVAQQKVDGGGAGGKIILEP